MRYLTFILLAFIIPIFTCPLTTHLWIDLGTGNANFLFFQQLFFWIGIVLYVIEIAAIECINDNKCDVEIDNINKINKPLSKLS